MDCREDEIILIPQRRARLIADGVRWIERQFGQKLFAGWIGCCDLFELQKVGLPHGGVFVYTFEARLVPAPRTFHFRRPPRAPYVEPLENIHESVPVLA